MNWKREDIIMHYIACFGDSLIQGFPFGEQYSWIATVETAGEIKMLNYGVCGDCCDDIFERLRDSLLPEYIHHILFLGGANDILQLRPQNTIIEDLKKVLLWCNEQQSDLCIVLPFISADRYLNVRLNNLRESIKKELEQAFLLDVQPAIGVNETDIRKAYLDGVHPTVETYKAIGTYAFPFLKEWLESTKKFY
ncbi:MAG: GDSL-type esterase/lipase family protein [Phascolarctobacterium sp.]|nr:GDSL-type esterase/lipase family protein [Phascolarctobacterium sp.]